MPSKRQGSPRRIILFAMVGGAMIVAVAGLRATQKMTGGDGLAGVQLGASVDEVRAGFEPPVEGLFMVGSEGGEPLLEWHPRGPGAEGPSQARFTFEDGGLARMMVRWPPGTSFPEARRALGIGTRPAGDGLSWRVGAGTATWKPDEGPSPWLVWAKEDSL